MNTPDSISRTETIAAPLARAGKAPWENMLSSINMAWKMALMIAVMSLGAIGVALTSVQGLGVMRYHLSNIYDFMLIPIVAINQADTSLADTQLHLDALRHPGLTPVDQATNISDVQASEATAVEILTRYDTEWVTTSSPEFTAILRNLGRMDLQKDELSTLAAYHTAYDKYVQTREAYLASVGAGTPDDQLGNQAVDLLAQARQQLARLIAVNNEFAQLSNQAAVSAYRQTLINTGLAFSLTLLLGLAASYVIARSITWRLGSLADAASSVQQGNLTLSLTVTGQDEIAKLSEAFNDMTTQLRDLIGTLEQRVAERTRVAEQRATQIAAGAQVARVATSVLDPEQLVTQVVDLIQKRFDYYYVGLFLLDESSHFAVLQAGTGEAGHVMKEHGHRLEVGGDSMVGWACARQEARIALDVDQEAKRFANPLLPKTRSEMALPLRAGDRVIGALDVQSTLDAAFDENDVAALQGMADQIATAMENARLFQETQKALQERDSLSGLLVRQGWQEYLTQVRGARFAEFGQAGTRPAGPDSLFTPSGPFALRIPLELRGQTLGTLVMERSNDGQPWQTDEAETIRAVAQQATLALDSARLFEEAQMAAARERLLNEITARIRSTATLDGVLNSAVREISALTGASYAAIELELAEEAQGQAAR